MRGIAVRAISVISSQPLATAKDIKDL